MPPANPTILFAQGDWHTSGCFDRTRHVLGSRGYPVETIDYPSVGAEPPTKTADDDSAVVRGLVQRLVWSNQGKSVVIVAHSYGSVVASNAIEGLGYKSRAQEGKSGGVITVIYLSGCVLTLGMSIYKLMGEQDPPWMRREGEYVYVDTPIELFYHDLEPKAQQKAVAALKHQSGPCHACLAKYEPWKDGIECMVVYCDEDKSVPPELQKILSEAALGPDVESVHIKSSHSPFLSKPGEMSDAVEFAAKLGLEKTGQM